MKQQITLNITQKVFTKFDSDRSNQIGASQGGKLSPAYNYLFSSVKQLCA